jgi:exocyst complex protein 7
MENYEIVAWGEVFSSLPENPTAAALSAAEAREVFMKFNLELEKAYRTQSTFVVPESKFCEDIKASLARKIVPIYREFYDRHYIMAGNITEMKEYVNFIPENVQNYLVNLFGGIGVRDE